MFEKGNKAAKGHQKTQTKIKNKFRKMLNDSITEEDFQKVVERLMKNCTANDIRLSTAAIRLLFDFLMGKPTQEIDLNTTEKISLPQVQATIFSILEKDKEELEQLKKEKEEKEKE